jgi:hypothetical protein
VVNGEMSLRRLKLSIHEVVTPRGGGGGGGGGGEEGEGFRDFSVLVSDTVYVVWSTHLQGNCGFRLHTHLLSHTTKFASYNPHLI